MYVYLAKNVIDLAEGAEQLNDRKQKKNILIVGVFTPKKSDRN